MFPIRIGVVEMPEGSGRKKGKGKGIKEEGEEEIRDEEKGARAARSGESPPLISELVVVSAEVKGGGEAEAVVEKIREGEEESEERKETDEREISKLEGKEEGGEASLPPLLMASKENLIPVAPLEIVQAGGGGGGAGGDEEGGGGGGDEEGGEGEGGEEGDEGDEEGGEGEGGDDEGGGGQALLDIYNAVVHHADDIPVFVFPPVIESPFPVAVYHLSRNGIHSRIQFIARLHGLFVENRNLQQMLPQILVFGAMGPWPCYQITYEHIEVFQMAGEDEETREIEILELYGTEWQLFIGMLSRITIVSTMDIH